ncbi:scoloptoxin SSD14-like [Dermacentor silvarum]|uniref:scoloptoxin SSD14-like n=1 Tax=Dermacentor silvarum TaxID=543639 RepID=UPI00210191CF|nr:scoloptoxin SSD14-like [Dermacentor silvarum]
MEAPQRPPPQEGSEKNELTGQMGSSSNQALTVSKQTGLDSTKTLTLLGQAPRWMYHKGGNAIDAAVATLLCHTLALPISSGIGGGFVATIYWAWTGSGGPWRTPRLRGSPEEIQQQGVQGTF